MNFKNMSIKKSLIVGFGTTILISAIIIIASLIMMNVQKSSYMNIISKYVRSNELVSQCRIDYNLAARGLRDVVLSGDDSGIKAVEDEVTELVKQINDLKNTYPLTDKSKLNTFTDTVDEWEEEAKKIINAISTNREQAAQMIVTSCTPKLAAAAAAGDALAEELQNEQDKIINQQNLTSNIGLGVIIAVM